MNFIEPVKDLFIAESKELLEKMEKVTLSLESHSDKNEALRDLFRCIHSIKGSSGMFGFESIEYFLHHFENLLDELRNGAIQPSKPIDHAQKLIEKPGSSLKKAEKTKSEQLIKQMEKAINQSDSLDTNEELIDEVVDNSSSNVEHVSIADGWIVEFSLTKNGFLTEFDPTYILADLEDLGWKSMTFIPGNIPNLLDYDSEKPFGRWLIQYGNTVNELQLEDVFAFVDDELAFSIQSTAPHSIDDFEDDAFEEEEDVEFKMPIKKVFKVEDDVKVDNSANEVDDLVLLEDDADEEQEEIVAPKNDLHTEQQTSIRVNVSVLEDLLNLVSELVLNRNQFMQLAQADANHQLTKHVNQLNRLTSEIQETAMRTRMQAIGTSWTRLPRIVRDLSTELGKEVDLKMEGETTELDRQVMQHISEPMVHLIRNALDHGIEKKEVRTKNGKPAKGRIQLNAYHRGGHIIIEVSDDGKGIDHSIIKKKAIEKGLIAKELADKLSNNQIYDYLFHPGFSTAEKITKLSGRGVGLDVVKKHIEELGGSIEVNSELGNGSQFKIKIPLTLAIISALIVKSNTHFYAIPELGIQELVWLNEENLDKVIQMQGNLVLTLRDTLLPLISLEQILHPDIEIVEEIENKHVVVIQNGDLTYGLIVDKVDQIQEIVVKPLNKLLKTVQVYSGTTLIGSEQIVLILDLSGLAIQANLNKEDFIKKQKVDQNLEAEIEKTLFLLFKNGVSQKAVHLGLVARLEELASDKLEEIDGHYVIQYRDHILPLIQFRKGIIHSEMEKVPIIVFQTEHLSFGLVVEGFSDIAEEAVSFEQISKKPGILGMAVLNSKSTEIIDVNWFFQQVSIAQHNVQLKEKGFVTVLLAEKSDFLRNHIKSVLQAAGMHIVAVSSMNEALVQLKKQTFQLVMSGIELQDGDGFLLANAIHKDESIPATIILSVSSHNLDHHPQRDQFTDHITGFDKDIILETLQRVLSHNGLVLPN